MYYYHLWGFLIIQLMLLISTSLAAAENSLCQGKLFLPQVNLSDGSAYSVWLLRENNDFVLSDEVKLIQHPDTEKVSTADYQNEVLNLTSVIYSQGGENVSYQAQLKRVPGSVPWRFRIQQAELEVNSEQLNQHACLTGFILPQAVKIDGGYHLRYELFLQDVNAQEKNIEKIEVWDQSQLVAEYKGDALTELLSGYRADDVAFAFLTIETDRTPDILQNRVTIANQQSGQVEQRQYEIVVDKTPVRTIAAPVKDGVWYFGELGAHDHHAQFLDFTYAYPLNSQRWAVDLLKVWVDEEQLCLQDCSQNEQFAAYAQPFYAVAEGTIAAIYNGAEDNLPGQVPENLSAKDYAGNYILLDIGKGIYALYGHVLKDSIAVNVGDSVSSGQILGKIGNSGNSTAPHLHFHLAKLNDPEQIFNGEGVPFTFKQFHVIDPEPAIRNEEMPADDSIILFD